jgi:Spy/CpxP family protein refolding chaperone
LEDVVMKENYKTLAFIFSAMLNVVFIVSTAHYRLPPYSASGKPPASCGLLFEQLNLTRDQADELRYLRDRFHERMGRIGSDIKERQGRLVELLSAPSPSREEITSAKEEILDLQGLMQAMLTSHVMETRAVMTPEQYSRFLGLIRDKIQTNCSTCPPTSVNR